MRAGWIMLARPWPQRAVSQPPVYSEPHSEEKCPPLKGGNTINHKRSLTKGTFHKIWQDLIDESASRCSGVRNQPRLRFSFSFIEIYTWIKWSFPPGAVYPQRHSDRFFWKSAAWCNLFLHGFSMQRKKKSKKTLYPQRPLTLARCFNWANVKPVPLLAEF